MSKKKLTKIGLTAAVAASAVVATNPAQAASVSEAQTLVNEAAKQANALKPLYSVTKVEQVKTLSKGLLDQYNKAKSAISKAQSSVKTIKGADKAKLEASLTGANEHVARAARLIDAIKVGQGLAEEIKAVQAIIDEQKIDADAVKAYDKLSYELKKAEAKISAVYGPAARSAVNDAHVKPAKQVKETVIYEVSIYLLVNKIDALVEAGKLEEAEAQLAVLDRLQVRADEIKEAGGYTELPLLKEELQKVEAEIRISLDTEAPVITLTGEETVKVANGAEYKDAGATAADNRDKEVEVVASIKDPAGKAAEAIDTKVAGEWTITYTAKDANGNEAKSVARKVVVAEALPKADSVKAINETTVEAAFPADSKITAADLAGKTIKVVTGEKEVVASYKADSFKDGKATFVLSGTDKLVDAAAYTVEADWASFEGLSFVAKVAPATYIKTVEAVTTKLPANTAASDLNLVYFSAKDQYGEALGLTGKVSNLNVSVKVNGVPLTASEFVANLANGNVEINNDLAEGNTVSLTFTNVIGEETKEVGTVSYVVAKAETSVPTTISNLTAKYSGSAANGHVIGEAATEVLASDEITLSVDVKNQFNNPLANQAVRWVVEAGSSKITKTDGTPVATTDAATFTFKAVEAGNVTISAYLANGQKVTYDVAIGAKKLDTISAATFSGNLYNHEEATSAALTINSGAVLNAANVKFQVTEAPQGATAADIQLVAVQGTTDADKYKVYVKAVTSKPGTFKFKAYVGSAIDAPNAVVADESTITTTVNQTVANIDVASFARNELTAGTEVKKDITFKNKHGEVVSVNAKDLRVVATTNMAVKAYDAQGNQLTLGTTETPVAKLSFEGTQAKSDTVTIVAGSVTKQVNTSTVAAAELTSFVLDGSNVSVITDDALDVATPSSDDLVAISGGDTYRLIPVSFKDQYGNVISVNANQFDVAVTGTAAGTQPVVELWGAKADGTAALLDNASSEVKFIAVKAEAGDTSQELTLQLKNEAGSANIGQAVKLNVNVLGARKAASFTAPSLATKVTNGISQTIDVSEIEVKDQYGRDFAVSEIGNAATTPDSYKWVVEGQENNDAIGESYSTNDIVLAAKASGAGTETVTLKLVYTGATTTPTDDVVVGSKAYNFTVGSLASSIAKIEIQPTVTVANTSAANGTYNAGAYSVALEAGDQDQTVAFTVKAFNADGEEVAINQSTGVIYTVTNDSITNGAISFDGNVATVDSDGAFDNDDTFTIKAISLNGKEDTLTVKVADIATAAAKAGSYYFSATGTGTEAVTSVEVNQTSTVHVVGVNQFGKAVNVVENNDATIRAIHADDAAIVQATGTATGITLTGKAVGTTNVRVILADGSQISIPVTVKTIAPQS